MIERTTLKIATDGRGFYRLDGMINRWLRDGAPDLGIVNCFIQHTSASLTITENADPDVLQDLAGFAERLARDGDPVYRHSSEGADDMSAHIRSILTATSVSVPVEDRRLVMGTWQGLFLWEHRYSGHLRRITVTMQS